MRLFGGSLSIDGISLSLGSRSFLSLHALFGFRLGIGGASPSLGGLPPLCSSLQALHSDLLRRGRLALDDTELAGHPLRRLDNAVLDWRRGNGERIADAEAEVVTHGNGIALSLQLLQSRLCVRVAGLGQLYDVHHHLLLGGGHRLHGAEHDLLLDFRTRRVFGVVLAADEGLAELVQALVAREVLQDARGFGRRERLARGHLLGDGRQICRVVGVEAAGLLHAVENRSNFVASRFFFSVRKHVSHDTVADDLYDSRELSLDRLELGFELGRTSLGGLDSHLGLPCLGGLFEGFLAFAELLLQLCVFLPALALFVDELLVFAGLDPIQRIELVHPGATG